jgi:sulfate adenylyltransferase subunit 1 (EFTu-like GTPase family)
MTIHLGFALFVGPDGKPIGVIGLSGHEDFLRNMVAGAYGVDLPRLMFADHLLDGSVARRETAPWSKRGLHDVP